MKKMIRSLSMALMLMVSLAGVTPSAFATTKFGVMIDFTTLEGFDAGGAFLSFDVDPDNLPFDQWIDLSTVTGFEMDAWVTTPDRNAFTFTEQDNTGSVFPLVHFENLNPIFPVRFDPQVFNEELGLGFVFDFQYVTSSQQFLQMRQFGTQLGTGSGEWSSSAGSGGSGSSGEWNVTAAWFDDPIPAVVPVPGAVWLFGGALALLGAVRRRALLR